MTAFVRAILVNLKSTIPVEYTDFVHAAVNATIPSIEVFSALEKNPDDLYQPKNVTTIFNLAKVFEDQRLDTKAEDIYVAILSYYPTYLDCYIRLGEMERSRGNIRLATSLFKEIMMEDENHVGAWSEVGTNQLLAGEVLPAQKSFERLGERDSYGVIQLSNVYLQSMGRLIKCSWRSNSELISIFVIQPLILRKGPSLLVM
jgi:tetratricopeptide (TPR) repeat protein